MKIIYKRTKVKSKPIKIEFETKDGNKVTFKAIRTYEHNTK